jgi:hypothetical protein
MRLCTLTSRRHGRLGADVCVDASIGGRPARAAGVPMLSGLGEGSLSRESLSLGWLFEVEDRHTLPREVSNLAVLGP